MSLWQIVVRVTEKLSMMHVVKLESKIVSATERRGFYWWVGMVSREFITYFVHNRQFKMCWNFTIIWACFDFVIYYASCWLFACMFENVMAHFPSVSKHQEGQVKMRTTEMTSLLQSSRRPKDDDEQGELLKNHLQDWIV